MESIVEFVYSKNFHIFLSIVVSFAPIMAGTVERSMVNRYRRVNILQQNLSGYKEHFCSKIPGADMVYCLIAFVAPFILILGKWTSLQGIKSFEIVSVLMIPVFLAFFLPMIIDGVARLSGAKISGRVIVSDRWAAVYINIIGSGAWAVTIYLILRAMSNG